MRNTNFEVLQVPDDVAYSAKVMYPTKFIVPQCFINNLLTKVADRACSLFIDQDAVFYKEIEQFKKHTEAHLRNVIMNEGAITHEV